MMKTEEELQAMEIWELAELLASEYPKIKSPGRGSLGAGQHPAHPYYEAMLTMKSTNDTYGAESGRYIILGFLSNASGIRSENATGIRRELKRRVTEDIKRGVDSEHQLWYSK